MIGQQAAWCVPKGKRRKLRKDPRYRQGHNGRLKMPSQKTPQAAFFLEVIELGNVVTMWLPRQEGKGGNLTGSKRSSMHRWHRFL